MAAQLEQHGCSRKQRAPRSQEQGSALSAAVSPETLLLPHTKWSYHSYFRLQSWEPYTRLVNILCNICTMLGSKRYWGEAPSIPTLARLPWPHLGKSSKCTKLTHTPLHCPFASDSSSVAFETGHHLLTHQLSPTQAPLLKLSWAAHPVDTPLRGLWEVAPMHP